MGRRMTHLHKHPKTGGWYHRRSVKARLRPYIAEPHTGKTEILISLRTKDRAEAEVRNKVVGTEVDRFLFDAERKSQTQSKWGDKPWRKVLNLTYDPSDVLIEMEDTGNFLSSKMGAAASLATNRPAPPIEVGVSIRQLYGDYINERKPKKKTDDSWRVSFRRFFEITGLDWDSDIASVTKSHARQFKQAMLKLPRTTLSLKYKGKTTAQIIEMADKEDAERKVAYGESAKLVERVASKTAERDMSAISAVLNFGVKDRYFGDNDVNPFSGITVDTVDSKSWSPFTNEQLRSIFSDDIFKESAWGSNQWMICLGYATGAREEEIGALRVDEVINGANITDGDNWYINIDTLHRSLKTDTSKRQVPIHAAIIDIGFLEYVENRRAGRHTYLFDLVEYRGSRTQRWSKWFNQTFLPRVGAKTKQHVFHSWRHTFVDRMREAGIEDRLQDALTGHKPPGMNPRYGTRQPLSALRNAIDRIQLPFLVNLRGPAGGLSDRIN